MLKLNADGVILGKDQYNSLQNGNDLASGIVVDPSGNIYIAGYTSTPDGGTQFLTLKYSNPPKIEQKPNGAIHLEFHTAPNQPYAIEATTNLFNWLGLTTNTADATGLFQFDDTNAPALPQRFYRGNSLPNP